MASQPVPDVDPDTRRHQHEAEKAGATRLIRRVIVVRLAPSCGVLGLSSVLIGPLGLTGVSHAAVGLSVLPGVVSALLERGSEVSSRQNIV